MNLLLSYYGDDFTGSTDVMEALARAGLRTVLFLQPPSVEHLRKFPGLRAFGIAGGSRAMSPAEMERELPPAFEALKASGAPLIHYKICSTFDSSPAIGSIGKAIEIGRRVFGNSVTPLVVGAPVLGRYVVFGNLFARSGLETEPYRLDRHPTMSRHPVTPMDEADLRLQLARQTALPVELADVLQLDEELVSDEEERAAAEAPSESASRSEPRILLFDTLREAHLAVIGRRIARFIQPGKALFCAGSSGLEYALVMHWRRTGEISSAAEDGGRGERRKGPAFRGSAGSAVRQIVGVSGSCSPVTDRQLARAASAGFQDVAIDPVSLLKNDTAAVISAATGMVARGQSVILHTSRGPGDKRLISNLSPSNRTQIGTALGELLDRLLSETGLGRAIVCGGDTSMAAARALGIEALEFLAPVAPGSPLCRVHAPGRRADGCEMVFKGGQVGRDSFFLDVIEAGNAANQES